MRKEILSIILIGLLILNLVISYSIYNLQKRTLDIISNITVQVKTEEDMFRELLEYKQPTIDDYDPKFNENEKIVIFEYTDYQCPFCSRHNLNVFPLIKERYIDRGLINYVYKDFPLDRIHPYARMIASYLNCAYKIYGIEKYSVLKVKVFRNQSALKENAEEFLRKIILDENLDYDKISKCANSTEAKTDIENDLSEITEYNFMGTPSFLIMFDSKLVTKNKYKKLKYIKSRIEALGVRFDLGKTYDGRYLMIMFSGALPYEVFSSILDTILERSAAPS